MDEAIQLEILTSQIPSAKCRGILNVDIIFQKIKYRSPVLWVEVGSKVCLKVIVWKTREMPLVFKYSFYMALDI